MQRGWATILSVTTVTAKFWWGPSLWGIMQTPCTGLRVKTSTAYAAEKMDFRTVNMAEEAPAMEAGRTDSLSLVRQSV